MSGFAQWLGFTVDVQPVGLVAVLAATALGAVEVDRRAWRKRGVR